MFSRQNDGAGDKRDSSELDHDHYDSDTAEVKQQLGQLMQNMEGGDSDDEVHLFDTITS